MTCEVFEVTTHNAAETEALGAALGKALRVGDCVAMFGGLGAGKTAFARGVGAAMGVAEVCSPTFTICMEHAGRVPLAHMDAYRLQSSDEFFEMGLDEVFSRAATLIEWADNVRAALPESRMELTFRDGERDGERVITARAHCGAETLLAAFKENAAQAV